MVQEKRSESLSDFSRSRAKEFNEQNPIIDVGWAVEEVRPAYNTGGYYDVDVPEKRKTVSPMFSEESEAVVWKNNHVADKGKYLVVSTFTLREFRPKPYRKWERRRTWN